MDHSAFISKWRDKGCDFDGFYGYQCMDLAHQYAVEVHKQDIPSAPAAKDVWDKNCVGYTKILNTPEAIPEKGDIIIWGVEAGPYGHIAIFDNGDQNSFTSFDQNWPVGSICHLQKHNYKGVIGWLKRDSAEIAQPMPQEPSIFLKTAVIESYVGILGITPSDDELKSRMKQLEGGAILHDIISQILNQDGRSPLVKLQEEMRLLKNNNETLTRVNRELMEAVEIYKKNAATTANSTPVTVVEAPKTANNTIEKPTLITSVIDLIKQLFK
jgi:hypothetical protein